jgi:hypothetical protein
MLIILYVCDIFGVDGFHFSPIWDVKRFEALALSSAPAQSR